MLQSFDHISVREEDGVKICKNIFDCDATQTLDPVFLCSKEKYEKLITKESNSEPYIFTYILSPTAEIGKKIRSVSKNRNMKIISVVDRQFDCKQKIEKLGIDECVHPDIIEWLSYVYNSSLIITDSYHGVCFSLIFNKPFICIKNLERGLSRFESIANVTGVNDVMFNSINEIKSVDCAYNINYEEINNRLEKEKKKSLDWLKNALSSKKIIRETKEMISPYEMNVLRSNSRDLIKWKEYAEMHKTLFLHDITPELFEKWFTDKGIKSVAIYGNMYPTEVIIKLLSNSSKITIEYIVENKCQLPFKIYPRDQDVFPKVDMIIIADLQNKKVINDKMIKKMDCAITSIDKIIKMIAIESKK